MAAALLRETLWDVLPSARCMAVIRPVRIPPIGPSAGASRHPRGIPLARVRVDLLAIDAHDIETRLRPMPSFPFFS
jgi:hypothetical protein